MTTGEAAETLTDLVMSVLQPMGTDTLDTLAPRCVDRTTGYAPSRNTVWKLASYERAPKVKINPQVVGAIAAGVGVSDERAGAAAAYQFTGYRASSIGSATIVHDADTDPGDAPKSRSITKRWEQEESEGNHPGGS